MAKPTSNRQAKIQAATPRGTSGANRIVVAGIVIILAIVVTVAAVIIADQRQKDQAASGGSALPTGVSAMGEGLNPYPDVTPVDGAPTLDIYEDFQCPVCKQFEDQFGETVTELGQSGKAKLRFHVLTFLDDNLRNDSSSRAATAAMCAADQGAFPEFHRLTYAGQPAQEGAGWTDDQLRGFAEDAGIEGTALDEWDACVDEQSHNQYIESVQTQASKDGVNGTPTVKLDGEQLNVLGGMSVEDFRSAVEGAA